MGGPVGATMSRFALMGFDAFVYNRIPDDAKASPQYLRSLQQAQPPFLKPEAMWAAERGLNFVWRGTSSLAPRHGDMFAHILDAYGYCPPNQPRNWALWDDTQYWGPQGRTLTLCPCPSLERQP